MKLLSKITFSGNNDIVVWRHPHNSFTHNTELVVPYTHEAILIKDGQAQGTYKPGKHIINEQTALKFSLFSKKEADIYEVYFINKSLYLPIKWGTRTQMDLFDPMLNIPVRVGAHGEFEIKISNPRKFLLKIVGNAPYMNKEMIQDFFRDKMSMYIKNSIAEAMTIRGISYYQIASHLKSLSDIIKKELLSEFDNYGTSLESFLIASVVIPEDIKQELEREFVKSAKEKIKNNTLLKDNNKQEKETNTVKTQEAQLDKSKTEKPANTESNKLSKSQDIKVVEKREKVVEEYAET